MAAVDQASAPTRADLEIEFPRKPEYVRTVRQAVATLARLAGGDDGAVEDIKLAVSEACNTAVNREGTEEGLVELLAWPSPEGLIVELLDPGATFEHSVAGPPAELSTEDLPFEHALALPIIRGLAAEVAVEPLDGGGTRLRMVLSLEPAGAS